MEGYPNFFSCKAGKPHNAKQKNGWQQRQLRSTVKQIPKAKSWEAAGGEVEIREANDEAARDVNL